MPCGTGRRARRPLDRKQNKIHLDSSPKEEEEQEEEENEDEEQDDFTPIFRRGCSEVFVGFRSAGLTGTNPRREVSIEDEVGGLQGTPGAEIVQQEAEDRAQTSNVLNKSGQRCFASFGGAASWAPGPSGNDSG